MTRLLRMTLLATFALPGAQAGEIGRLFFTPQQRVQLEREHAQQIPQERERADQLVLNGIVQHDGKRTVWINGVAQVSGCDDHLPPDTHTVAVPGKPHPVELKVGQHLSIESGQ